MVEAQDRTRARHHAGERGTSTIEYVMLLSMICVVALGGAHALASTVKSQFNAATIALADSDSGSAGSGTGSDSSGGGSTPTSPPTVPPTTAAPTTTARAPATTTTTIPVAVTGSTDWSAPTAYDLGSYWIATATMTVTDDLGEPVAGAKVTVTVRAYTKGSNGKFTWVSKTQVVTTGSNGTVTVTSALYKSSSGTSQVTKIDLTVNDVDLPHGLDWAGDQPIITIPSP